MEHEIADSLKALYPNEGVFTELLTSLNVDFYLF